MTGAVLAVEIRAGFYLDSVALMRISRAVSDLPGVAEAALMIGTEANKSLLRDAGLLDSRGEGAGPDDLIVAMRARDEAAVARARTLAIELLDAPRAAAGARGTRPKSLAGALDRLDGANLALLSVPGEFAAAEARKALDRGLHVMLFSDHVAVADEVELKTRARAAGLLVMGPDCGSALIGGCGLGFANVVRGGDVGIVAASGTGLQEVSCLVSRLGGGVSHAIGVGGRDLSAAVGGLMTAAALAALARDAATGRIVVVSKPPHPAAVPALLRAVADARKPVVLCLIGADALDLPANAVQAPTLAAAAALALGREPPTPPRPGGRGAAASGSRRLVGLFCGGTLCAEAQAVARARGLAPASNVPLAGLPDWDEDWRGHALLDLGADAFTLGRPHPMIDPRRRGAMLAAALADGATGVALVDLVLGYGAHPDPAGRLVDALPASAARPPVVASVCGTDEDPQPRGAQVRALERAGVIVAPSNAAAAARAIDLLEGA